MLKGRLPALIEAFGDCRVRVAGDVIADGFIYGKISRVSRWRDWLGADRPGVQARVRRFSPTVRPLKAER